ncbi:hypothetical protein AX15_005341 [Amanita polypyramis BW_CC]|nr:hypothetical protein AX15_005341 [Amanita polypyramis BW_CC]
MADTMAGLPRHSVSVGDNANFSGTIGLTLGVRTARVDRSRNTIHNRMNSPPVSDSERRNNDDHNQASGASSNTDNGPNSADATDDSDNSSVEDDNGPSGVYVYDSGNESDDTLSMGESSDRDGGGAVVAKLPRKIGAVATNVGKLRALAKLSSSRPPNGLLTNDADVEEDGGVTTPNAPVPLRSSSETELESAKRKMKWVA